MLAHEALGKISLASGALFFSMFTTIGVGVKLSKSLKIATIMARDSLFLILGSVVGSLGISRVIEYSLRFSRLIHLAYSIAPVLMDEKIGRLDVSTAFLAECMGFVVLAIHFRTRLNK